VNESYVVKDLSVTAASLFALVVLCLLLWHEHREEIACIKEGGHWTAPVCKERK
jgi:hypothetical protein